MRIIENENIPPEGGTNDDLSNQTKTYAVRKQSQVIISMTLLLYG